MPLIDLYRKRNSETLSRFAKLVQAGIARSSNARNSASLYCLPPELICEICEYISAAETFCLMICCARFWHAKSGFPPFVKVRQLVALPSLEESYRHDLAEIRFYILRLMEFDKMFGKGAVSFCCWACMCTHKRSRFRDPDKHVDLKLSIEEQRVNWTAAFTRSCKHNCRSIWAGICHEISFAELRNIQLTMKPCEGKKRSVITIPAERYFSENFEYNWTSNRLLYGFYLGRLSDLGPDGFSTLCANADIPICPHHTTNGLAYTLRQSLERGLHCSCKFCETKFLAKLVIAGFIEVQVSCKVGILEAKKHHEFNRISYTNMNQDLLGNCRAFADWLNRMYNPETGAVYNGGQFEMFTPTQRLSAVSTEPVIAPFF